VVIVSNKHPRIRLPKKPLIELGERIVEEEGSKGEVAVVLVDDETISQLNFKYRHRKGPTDVLSFPFHTEELLGDVFISLDTARLQAKEYGHNLTREVKLLLIHGILHLCGYDDQGKESTKKMRAREAYYLR